MSVRIKYIETPLNTNGFVSSAAVAPAGGEFLDPTKIVGYFGLSEGMRVADFGSGSGDFTLLMARLVGDSGVVTAIDILNTALDTLRAKSKIEGLGNIQTVRSNLESIGGSGLANDSQDFVLIANTLFQNPNKRLMIDEARRVIKPDGVLAILEWKKGAGGFGPPNDLRTTEEDMKQLVLASDGFQLADSINAGIFHYGIIFRKV